MYPPLGDDAPRREFLPTQICRPDSPRTTTAFVKLRSYHGRDQTLTDPKAASASGDGDGSLWRIGAEITGLVDGASPSFAGVRLLPKKCRNDDECDRDSPGSDVVGVIVTNDGAVGLVVADKLLSMDAIDSRFVERWLFLKAS